MSADFIVCYGDDDDNDDDDDDDDCSGGNTVDDFLSPQHRCSHYSAAVCSLSPEL